METESTDFNLPEFSQSIFERVRLIESKMSYFQSSSELNQLNQYAHQTSVTVSDEMTTILNFSLELSKQTDGLFDISVTPKLIQKGLLPDHGFKFDPTASWQDISIIDNRVFFEKPLIIELGGIAKGFAVDEALKLVQNQNIDVVVNAGGDLKMSEWQNKTVAIRHPNNPTQQATNITMQKAALATSGHYFLDGEMAITHPTQDIILPAKSSVSVFADSCMVADALTKVATLCEEHTAIFSVFGAKQSNIFE